MSHKRLYHAGPRTAQGVYHKQALLNATHGTALPKEQVATLVSALLSQLGKHHLLPSSAVF
jgi:hypothetical protein